MAGKPRKQRTASPLVEQPAARLVRGSRQVELFKPQIGVGVDLDERETQGAVDLLAEPAHPVEFLARRDDVLAGPRPAGPARRPPPPACGPAQREANSFQAPNVPGTGSPSMARCASVRDDEKPRAPASIASWTSFAMVLMSSAGSLRVALRCSGASEDP